MRTEEKCTVAQISTTPLLHSEQGCFNVKSGHKKDKSTAFWKVGFHPVLGFKLTKVACKNFSVYRITAESGTQELKEFCLRFAEAQEF